MTRAGTGVVPEADADRARAISRGHPQHFLRLPNYVNNLHRLGYTEDDLTGGGSNRLVDDTVAWGDLDLVTSRIRAHFEAGADRVCAQVIAEDQRALPMEEWRALAEQLLS